MTDAEWREMRERALEIVRFALGSAAQERQILAAGIVLLVDRIGDLVDRIPQEPFEVEHRR